MKKSLILFAACCSVIIATAQQGNLTSIGREVKINLNDFTTKLQTANSPIEANLPLLNLPVNNGKTLDFRVKESPIMENQPADIKTYSGESLDKKASMRMTITPSRFSAIIHIDNGYYFIEPVDAKAGVFRFYNMAEAIPGSCGVDGQASNLNPPLKNGKVLSVAPFPIGTQLRTFRMAAAATSGMTATFGTQTAARDKIVEIINANNLIYQVEVSVKFALIAKTTTTMTTIFTGTSNPADPFVVDPNFASATNAQTGFDALNTNSALPNGLAYNLYDIGCVFNSYATGAGPTYYVRGQAGGTPCSDASKGTGWTEFEKTAVLGTIVNVFAHETAHQFSAWHTFNAVGGSNGNPTFCTGGWFGDTAVEPGSGSTLMGYGTNCSFPTNYVLSAPNKESYFHTKSIEQMLVKINTQSTCATSTATGNNPPQATAGPAFTIPKGTPFTLMGFAIEGDPNQTVSYFWEEYDIATANDKGAFGSTVNGTGGYSAVNSTASAPLFRSKSTSNGTRVFPSLNYILNNANEPATNEGEALPQASRAMKFRLTVKDNFANGGGVDSDELTVTVDGTKGPFLVTAPNGGGTFAAGTATTVTWSVNGTNTLSATINILLSIDGGNTFPYSLANNTANDGTESVTIPANVIASATCRVKIVSTSSNTADFFDISNGNFTITSTCQASKSLICNDATLTAEAGSGAMNLNLANTFIGNALATKAINITATSPTGKMVWFNTSGTACYDSPFTNGYNVMTFRVSKTGAYTFSKSNANLMIMSFFANSFTPNAPCPTFVGSNATLTDANTNQSSINETYTITLNACTTYYMATYDFFGGTLTDNVTITSTAGTVHEIGTAPVGYDYIYLAYNTNTATFAAVNTTSNFTTLPEGSYEIYGGSVTTGTNTAAFVGQSNFTVFENNCILYSENKKLVTVTVSTCPQTLTLTNPTNNSSTGTIIAKANQTITATNIITGGNVTHQAGNSVQLNPGFQVSGGAVYATKILAGCN